MIDFGIVIPKDAHTILRTQRKPVVDDSFMHLGLESGIVNCLRFGFTSETNEVILHVNIDGIPLFNSSNTSFWPILCRIIGAIDSSPFAISVYCGKSKPPNPIEFLSPFLNEFIYLISNGLHISNKLYTVKLVAIVGHTGYGASERCCQKGTRVKKRQVFHNLSFDLRNDSFRKQKVKMHHKGKSLFLSIGGFDMIRGFPLDPMHLVYLDVMRRLLVHILLGPLPHSFSAEQKKLMSTYLIELRTGFPQEITRKGAVIG